MWNPDKAMGTACPQLSHSKQVVFQDMLAERSFDGIHQVDCYLHCLACTSLMQMTCALISGCGSATAWIHACIEAIRLYACPLSLSPCMSESLTLLFRSLVHRFMLASKPIARTLSLSLSLSLCMSKSPKLLFRSLCWLTGQLVMWSCVFCIKLSLLMELCETNVCTLGLNPSVSSV